MKMTVEEVLLCIALKSRNVNRKKTLYDDVVIHVTAMYY